MFCVKCGSGCEQFVDDNIVRYRCHSCNYIYYKNPYPCVSVLVINNQGKILLGKRHKDSIFSEKWCLPCGYMEYEETYIAAAKREVKEEMGINIEPKGIINVVSNNFENGVSSLVIVLLAYYEEQNNLVPGDDITEADWFDINGSLPPLAFSADNFIITKYRESINKFGEITIITLEGNSFTS